MTDLDISPHVMRAVAHVCRAWGGEFRLRHEQRPGLCGGPAPREFWVAEIVSMDRPGLTPTGHGEDPEIAIREMLRMAGV